MSRAIRVVVAVVSSVVLLGCAEDNQTLTAGAGDASGSPSPGVEVPRQVSEGAHRAMDGDPVPAVDPTTSSSQPASDTIDGVESLSVYVDVDLECRAFRLDGAIWVMTDGDPSSWQPPGERHEGGTFVLDSPTTGTFSGDYAGTKVARFRRLSDGESPMCEPLPR